MHYNINMCVIALTKHICLWSPAERHFKPTVTKS